MRVEISNVASTYTTGGFSFEDNIRLLLIQTNTDSIQFNFK